MTGKEEAYVVSLIHIQISIHVPLVRAPDRARHAGPGLLEREHAFDVVARLLLARHGIDDRGLDAEERERGAARLCGRDAAQGRDGVGAGFGLPVCLFFEGSMGGGREGSKAK